MPLTNFPGGVASFGVPMAGQGSLYDMPCAEVIFVCNRAGVVNGDGTQRDRPKPSIADAVVGINTGVPSGAAVIYVLSGHAENVTGSKRRCRFTRCISAPGCAIPDRATVLSRIERSLRGWPSIAAISVSPMSS